MENLSKEEFYRGIKEYEKHEKRDAMYKVATFLTKYYWGKATDMADGLGVLLLTWNQAFYRFGNFDFYKLEECIDKNLQELKAFREREIDSLSESDMKEIQNLFDEFLRALQRGSGKKKGTKSPVAVAKALHILAPNFFPLWDEKIARHYKCYYNSNPAGKYIEFCKKIKEMKQKVEGYKCCRDSEKSVLKLIDEFNYSKYTENG